jgi:hypothetical protein
MCHTILTTTQKFILLDLEASMQSMCQAYHIWPLCFGPPVCNTSIKMLCYIPVHQSMSVRIYRKSSENFKMASTAVGSIDVNPLILNHGSINGVWVLQEVTVANTAFVIS